MEPAETGSRSASVRTEFEKKWRERFAEFAHEREDDAGIAGWSLSGLETRFRLFRRFWRAPATGASYLDAGCGAGTYSRWLAEQGLRVVGVDYSQPTLIKARGRVPAAVALCAADATRLPLSDSMFDGALCLGVLQAVSDSNKVIAELARVLKPGGELWIDALNVHGLAARFESARLHLKGKSMHLRYESPRQVSSILSSAGFGEVTLYWLPILPSGLALLQPLAESRAARMIFRGIPIAGMLLNHAFALHARRLRK
jgi:SAM-dependent methyltransferase